ncbi:MAG: ABC transporter ATP-binding protein [Deltaproteobacteria bacterium]|nr:ABC transporter ATP-binding protein [Deltaproteobacteria bacterium]
MTRGDGLPLLVEQLRVDRGKRCVLEGIDLRIDRGEVVALVGPNGSGKTTLLKAIAGLLPFAGKLLLGGLPAEQLSHRERACRVSYVPQQSSLDAALSVREVVGQGRMVHRSFLAGERSADLEAIDWAMVSTDVATLAQRPFNALSYGERRRVLLARALACRAPLVLLDEPTAALDIGHVVELFALIERIVNEQQVAVLIVLHQLHEVHQVAQRALLLHEGRTCAAGLVAQVLTPQLVERVYGVELIENAALGYRRLPRA